MATRLIALVLLAVVLQVAPVAAQDDPTSTTLAPVPDQDIVPAPNTGEEPDDAGDRGGALQLGLLALVVIAIGGAIVVVVRQSRQARAG